MVEIFVERRPEGLGEPSEEAAFADLYNRTYAPLVAYCRRYCPPGYDAEDIAQEALSRAWSSWDRYSPSRPFWPWVATIARRLCVDYWRRDERALARSSGTTVLEPGVEPRPDELTEAADECRMAVKAFRGLRPDHQRIVGLRDIEGWSYEDIARFEGVTVESIRGSLRRARMSLRKSYETLSKTALPGAVPGVAGGGWLARFHAARARLAVRMARWQASMADTGVASTRLGEALVSLMALSVAAVGLGTPGAAVVAGDLHSLGGSSAVSAPGLGGGAAGAAAGGSAGGGAASAGSAGHNVSPEWKASVANVGPGHLLTPSAPDSANNSGIYHFTEAANGVIFAAGSGRDGCPAVCGVLFRSDNGGQEWTGLKAVNLQGDRVILPPNYPDDPRIFATGQAQLQVSIDGGESFVPVTPSLGAAVMSPGFATGDPRILLSDVPGRQYDDRLGAITPLDLKPDANFASQRFSFAFPSAFDAAKPVMFVGASASTLASVQPSTVSRCEGTLCSQPVALAGTQGDPTLLMAHAAGGDVLYAYNGNKLFRSVDGAKTFSAVAMPSSVDGIMDIRTDSRGSLFMASVKAFPALKGELWRLDAGTTAWSPIVTDTLPSRSFTTVQPLRSGTLLVGMNGEMGGIACTSDNGATWAPHC
jgi:RNA polymerase sigma-70 factor (ECF subfamily)